MVVLTAAHPLAASLDGSGNTATVLQQQNQLIADTPPVQALKDWYQLGDIVKETIPVVIVTSHVPNDPYHPALVAIKQVGLPQVNSEQWTVDSE